MNYKTPELLKDCINSIYHETFDIVFEIIVVDNNSNDGSEELIKSNFPNVCYIQSGSNLGFGKANNIGVRNSRGRNILFLNSDTLLINNSVKILSEFLDINSKVGVCGGNLYDNKMNGIHSFSTILPGAYAELDAILSGKLSKIRKIKLAQFNETKNSIPVAYVCGANMMVKATVLEEVGLFDPDFFLYFEETELCYRILKQGFKIYNVPEAKIIHLEGASQTSSKSKLNFYNASRKVYYKKRYCLMMFSLACSLFRLKCFIGLIKNVILLDFYKARIWYNNLLTF